MKKTVLLSFITVLYLTGCDVISPMDTDLYPQKVYIVGAADRIVDRDLNIGYRQDTVSISVAVSGSRDAGQDVTVHIEEAPAAIEIYNSRELSEEVTHYRKLRDDLYSYPLDKVTIQAGNEYSTYPIYIQPASLHCDSLYMLALRLSSTSAYELNDQDTVALVRLNLTNDYSGLYYMDGIIKNTTNTDDSLSYKMPRNAVATDDGHTIRLYHYNNEFHNGDENDYRPTHTFKLSVNADNTLTFATWSQFGLIDGGGVYLPELKLFDLWYTYSENDAVWRVKGYLYKERETDEEQRIIDDWIEAGNSNY
jgi:hypothetical protein